MSRKVFRIIGWGVGIILVGIIGLVGFLIYDVAPTTDHLILQKTSTDGKTVAELHQLTTRMHGGADTIHVNIRPVNLSEGKEVYSQTYECSDFRAFRLQWISSNELKISYGTCYSERWHYKDDNKVWKRDQLWNNIKIEYEDGKYVATH
ncbi:MAG TPA: hypothetical protein VGJ33_11075 [Candidatus Angelobacter sp.]